MQRSLGYCAVLTILAAFRRMYEPYVAALSGRLRMPVDPLVPDGEKLDAWQTSPWSLPD